MEHMNEGIPVFAYGSDIMTDIWSTLSKKKGSSTLTIPTKKTTNNPPTPHKHYSFGNET